MEKEVGAWANEARDVDVRFDRSALLHIRSWMAAEPQALVVVTVSIGRHIYHAYLFVSR